MSTLFPSPVSAAFVDQLIWNIGLAKTPNNERNFLRGIHNPMALAALMAYLSSHQPGHAMRLTSAWVDKHPQARPQRGAFNCELGDLLVLWRLLDGSGRLLRRVGWMLQAKMADDASRMTHRDASSSKEYALYEDPSHWDFDVYHFAAHLGRFNLATDADIAPTLVSLGHVQHWSYLQIRSPNSAPIWTTPLQARWNSGTAHWLESLAEAITSMMRASPDKGAELDTCNPQWTALCDALEAFTASRDSALAGGPWQRSCVAFVPQSWAIPGFARQLGTDGAADFPTPLSVFSWGDSNFYASAAGDDAPADPERVWEAVDADGGGFGVVRVDSIVPDDRAG